MIRFNSLLFLAFILLAGCSSEEPVALEANSADQYREGVHYELLDNPTTVRDPLKSKSRKFWFGCNHCYALEPYIARWKRDISSDVSFIKSPATWNEMLKTHARISILQRLLGLSSSLCLLHSIQFRMKEELTGNTELEYYFRGFDMREININLFLLPSEYAMLLIRQIRE